MTGARGPVGDARGRKKEEYLPEYELESVPPCPRGINAEAQRKWESFWRSAVARFVDQDSDLPALQRWIWYVNQFNVLTKRVKKYPEPKHYAQIRHAEDQIAKFEERFGMTPAARKRLGLRGDQLKKSSVQNLRGSLKREENEDAE